MSSNTINKIIIFITGSAILSLELISSRVLNPYFGVSLYIWAGILSITLIALSVGYRRGGVISAIKYKNEQENKSKLQYKFLAQPAESSIAIAIACGFYPIIFYDLAMTSLVWGAFLASAFLLLIPLISMSSMNPILIAIYAISQKNTAGKSAGDVLFVSTIGSVAGVIVTSFIFIPNLSNFNTILLIGIILSLISLWGTFLSYELSRDMKKKLIITSSIGILLCTSLIIVSPTYLRSADGEDFGGHTWQIKDEYNSIFGDIKIVTRDSSDDSIYYFNNFRQSHIDSKGLSVSAYSYGMEQFPLSIAVSPKSALALGLAGGIVPNSLAKKGIKMDVVDIVPESLVAAKKHFNFDDKRINTYITDARTFVKKCSSKYEVVLIDIFAGGSVPEYLVTREFYSDVKNCITDDGFIVMNTIVASREYLKEYYHILKTLKSVYKDVDIYYDDTIPAGRPFTIFVVASSEMPSFDFVLDEVPESLRGRLEVMLKSPKTLNKSLMMEAKVLTDENNYYSFLSAKATLKHHRLALSSIPPMFLVN